MSTPKPTPLPKAPLWISTSAALLLASGAVTACGDDTSGTGGGGEGGQIAPQPGPGSGGFDAF